MLLNYTAKQKVYPVYLVQCLRINYFWWFCMKQEHDQILNYIDVAM